jgi:pimeloyl-ACP methyl ester carboxylesterase
MLTIQGQSYLLNEDAIGDSPHWDDTARDIIHMINVFQDEMPPPLIGIGQSWGGYPIVQAALYHPRLFTAIVPLEPYLAGGRGDADNFSSAVTILMAHRRDHWNSLAEARSKLLANPYFAAFDKEVFERVMKHDFRHLPDGSVELVTPKAQEVATMVRLIPPKASDDGADYESRRESRDEKLEALTGFYRPEPGKTEQTVAELLPPTLYVWGQNSSLKETNLRQFLMKKTGTAPGANGGEREGMVESAVVPGATHPMPLERPRETAETMVPWIQKQIQRWDKDVEESMKGTVWTRKVNPRWLEAMSKI